MYRALLQRTCQLRTLACAHGLAGLFCKSKNPAKVGLCYKRDLQIYMYCMDWHDSFTKVGLFYKRDLQIYMYCID